MQSSHAPRPCLSQELSLGDTTVKLQSAFESNLCLGPDMTLKTTEARERAIYPRVEVEQWRF